MVGGRDEQGLLVKQGGHRVGTPGHTVVQRSTICDRALIVRVVERACLEADPIAARAKPCYAAAAFDSTNTESTASGYSCSRAFLAMMVSVCFLTVSVAFGLSDSEPLKHECLDGAVTAPHDRGMRDDLLASLGDTRPQKIEMNLCWQQTLRGPSRQELVCHQSWTLSSATVIWPAAPVKDPDQGDEPQPHGPKGPPGPQRGQDQPQEEEVSPDQGLYERAEMDMVRASTHGQRSQGGMDYDSGPSGGRDQPHDRGASWILC